MNIIKKIAIEMFGFSKTEWNIGGIASLIGGIIGALLGGFDIMTKTLLTIMSLDILAGFSNSITKKKTSSSVGLRGLHKKLGILLMIALAAVLDLTFGDTGTLRAGAMAFYIAMESLSVVENLTAMGVPAFEPLAEYLIQIKEGNKKGPSKLVEKDEGEDI